jgi:hypothetical protein
MRIPGFNRPNRQPTADPAPGQVYLERRPGETTGAFEMRMAAAARESETSGVFSRRPVAASAAAAAAQPARRADVRAPPPPRRRRRGFGLVGMAVALVAVLGVLWLVLAAREGSFAGGGAVVDQKIAEVTSPARAAANQAVDRTGAAVQNAGQAIETQGQKIRKTAN